MCNKTKPLEEFYYQKGNPMRRCKECQRAYAREWAEINRDAMLKNRAKYYNSKYRTREVRAERAESRISGEKV